MRRSTTHFALCIALLPAVSVSAPNRALDDLSIPGVHWQRVQPASLQGVALAYRTFRSDESPVHVAAALAAGYPQFRQVLSVAGHLVLSGMHDDAHWLAHIEPGPAGTLGMISVLQIPAKSAPHAVPPTAYTSWPAWLPAQSRLVFDHAGSRSGALRQRVFRVPDKAGDLSAYLRRELRLQGWSSIDPGSSTGGPDVWQRRQSVMHVSVHSAGRRGSLLYVQEQR